MDKMKWNETKILIKSDLNRLGNINKWNSIKYLINKPVGGINLS